MNFHLFSNKMLHLHNIMKLSTKMLLKSLPPKQTDKETNKQKIIGGIKPSFVQNKHFWWLSYFIKMH